MYLLILSHSDVRLKLAGSTSATLAANFRNAAVRLGINAAPANLALLLDPTSHDGISQIPRVVLQAMDGDYDPVTGCPDWGACQAVVNALP
jgi:hypothetical protein